MKTIVENNIKAYFIDRVNKIYIGFDDNAEVELNQIMDYDLDLDNECDSTISFVSAFNDREIENRFKGRKSNHVIYVRMDVIAINPYDAEELKIFYDIPCDMKIRRLRVSGKSNCSDNMYIELEGIVK